ncbi:MAG TPA: helix-turn-helix domain-containing protein [Thermoanaerobaculia bacterium]
MPPSTSVALTLLRSARGWTQKELAEATGIPSGILSDYEKGRRNLSRERLESLAAALGLGPEDIEMSFLYLGFIHSSETPPDSPLALEDREGRAIKRVAAIIARKVTETVLAEMTRSRQAEKVQKARREAEELWERLKRYSPRERRVLVDSAREFHSWVLCERLCAESAKAAAADAGRALDLADLALRVAARVPGRVAWRSQVQGYAWAFIGNARRVASDLPGAEEAFGRAWDLWNSGVSNEWELLPEWRLLDLQASLRRAQRRLPEALDLLDRALATSRPGEQGRILLNKAFALEQLAEYERAIETLICAAPLVDAHKEPRLLFALRFNLAVNLCHLGRQGEAWTLVPEVRDLALQLGNPPDLVRVLWLEGRIVAELGRRQEAITAMEQVRNEFVAWGLAYDMALVSLELAVFYLEAGCTAEVKNLARQMTPVFQAQGVHREALLALRLFCEAVDKETITAEMARRLADYFKRARHEPGLKFKT